MCNSIWVPKGIVFVAINSCFQRLSISYSSANATQAWPALFWLLSVSIWRFTASVSFQERIPKLHWLKSTLYFSAPNRRASSQRQNRSLFTMSGRILIKTKTRTFAVHWKRRPVFGNASKSWWPGLPTSEHLHFRLRNINVTVLRVVADCRFKHFGFNKHALASMQKLVLCVTRPFRSVTRSFRTNMLGSCCEGFGKQWQMREMVCLYVFICFALVASHPRY